MKNLDWKRLIECPGGGRGLVVAGVLVWGLTSCGKPKASGDASGELPGQVEMVPLEAGAAATGETGPGGMTGRVAGTAADPAGAGMKAEVREPGAAAVAGAPAGAAVVRPDDGGAEALIKGLAEKMEKADWKGFLEMAGAGAATGANQLRLNSLTGDRGYRVSGPDWWKVSERGEGAKMMEVRMTPGVGDTALGEQMIELDLARDEAGRWGVRELRVPDILELAAAKMGGGGVAAGDPLGMAGQFLDAVVRRDFATARRMVDTGKLSDEKLAALFIVVEEGSFKPYRDKPLISTMARNNNAWVIARLESTEQQSDFGIELSRAAEGAPWQVVGLNFSKLIQNVAAQVGAGDIAYMPLQKDLKGGEQIVIYFEFDGAAVNPRAEKQLQIIGDILKEDPKRTLTIHGHADALGVDVYNEELSERRAVSVREFLASYGIPPQQVLTQGFGKSKPMAPNFNPDGTDNPSGRAQNRRAEVYLKF